MAKPEAEFKWIGPRPADNGEIEEIVRADMRLAGVDMRKPKNLVFSTVLLTDDFNGPVVTVSGGKKKFHAEYSPKAVWVSFNPNEDAGGAA